VPIITAFIYVFTDRNYISAYVQLLYIGVDLF
jgi:hypothetical protein